MLVKMGRAGPPFVPRRRPRAGKSGDPRSQNTDTFIISKVLGNDSYYLIDAQKP